MLKLSVKKGFSLVELLVVVTVMMVMAGGALVYINDFNAKQKMESTKKELVSSLRLARNYAVTNQMGDVDSLEYVQVEIADGVMEAWPNGVGSSYFSKELSPIGVGVSLVGVDCLRFSSYGGKLVKRGVGDSLVPVGIGESVAIVISSGEVGSTLVVEVQSSGLVDEK